ncbi:MAG: hypothetical protein J2P30_01505 [Actinobacteria bacterium]|nr:hypothetical protein [Actinomycetota bacterium]
MQDDDRAYWMAQAEKGVMGPPDDTPGDAYPDHDCPKADFLDDPITVAYGVGGDFVGGIACPVCEAHEAGEPTYLAHVRGEEAREYPRTLAGLQAAMDAAVTMAHAYDQPADVYVAGEPTMRTYWPATKRWSTTGGRA